LNYVQLGESRRSFAAYLQKALETPTCQELFETIRDGTVWDRSLLDRCGNRKNKIWQPPMNIESNHSLFEAFERSAGESSALDALPNFRG